MNMGFRKFDYCHKLNLFEKGIGNIRSQTVVVILLEKDNDSF